MNIPAEILPERNLVILSPHYDDVGLTWGGILHALAVSGGLRDKTVRIVLLFSRSNYQARSAANGDTSLARIQHATGIRLIEDMDYLDAVLGTGCYAYELAGLAECVLRGTSWKSGEDFEFPQGNRSTFSAGDWDIFARIKGRCSSWLRCADTALLVPLAVKEHVDHVLVRDAVVEARNELGRAARCRICFGEDQPYAGLASPRDQAVSDAFIADLGLVPVDCPIDVERKADLIMRHYPSQVEDSYHRGIMLRSHILSRSSGFTSGTERIHHWGPPS